MSVRLSLILATSGRVDLALAVHAAKRQMVEGDELLIVGGGSWAEAVAFWAGARHVPHAPGGDWGNTERNTAMPLATGTHLLFIDDDDALTPGALAAIRAAVAEAPARCHVFRMITPEGLVLPLRPVVAQGNLGTPMFVAPNVPEKLGRWSARYEGDFDYIVSTLAYYPDGPVWHHPITYACRVQGRRAWGLA